MEEENICRVCRCEGTPEDPLFYPCLCSGSIKYIHQDCLVQWLQHSKKKYCELCNHPFSFSPVYDESMPQTLPKTIFLVGAFQKMIALSKIWIRYCLVFFSWLIVVPFITTHIWNLYFPRDSEVEFTLRAIAADCLTGALISGSVVITFLGLMSLRDYIVSHAILRDQLGRAAGHRGRRDRRQADVAPPAPAPDLAPAPALAAAPPLPEAPADGELGPQPPLPLDDPQILEEEPMPPALGDDQIPPAPADPWENNTHYPDFRGWDEDLRHAMQDPRVAQANPAEPVEGADFEDSEDEDVLDGLDDFEDTEDEDSEDDDAEDEEEPLGQGPAPEGPHEELSFEELVGLKGSIFILFENVFWMLLFNAVFLGSFAFLPFATGNLLRQLKMTDYLAQKALEMFGNSTSLNSTLPDFLNATGAAAGNATGDSHRDVFDTAINRAFSIFLGYSLLACFILTYMAISSSIFSQDSPFNRYLLRITKFSLVFLKVSGLLILELAFFPLMCGCVVDLITLDLLNSTVSSRLAFFHTSPFTFLFVHWFLGNTYMFHFSTFVSLLREILRPGVLWFLRNPNDPSFQPLREIIELPLKRHIKRIFVSAIFYNVILLVLVYGVIQVAKYLFPSLYPLNIITSDPLSELPIDLLLIHIAFPFGFERVNPIHLFTSSVKLWFKLISRALCLSSYLLGKNNEDENIPGTTLATVLNKDVVDLFNETDPADELSNTTTVYCPPQFRFRIGVMLFLLTISGMLFNMTALFLPILTGRFLFSFFVSRSVHELYTFGVGLCVIWGAIMFTIWIVTVFENSRTSLTTLRTHTVVVFKFTYLFFFMGMLIPLCIGLLFQLMFVKPFTVAANQSAVFFIFQDWALGALQAKVLHRLVTLGPENRWKLLLENLSRNGIQGTDMWAFSNELLFPFSAFLLGSLTIPMAFSLGVLPLFGLEQEEISHISRFSYLGLFILGSIVILIHSFLRWLDQLQQSIRDERYLVGQRLHNLDRNEPDLHQGAPTPSVIPPLVN